MKLPDGSEGFTKYNYYACINNCSGRKCDCTKKSHKNNTIEEPVLQEIYKYFDLLETTDLSEYVRKIHKGTKNVEGSQIKELERNIKDTMKENDLLKREIIKVIKGKSTFTDGMLTELINENNKKIEDYKKRKAELETLKRQKEVDFEQMMKVKNLIPNWKEVLMASSIEKKKMILSQVIKEVVVYDDKIDVYLRINFKEFLETAKKLDEKTKIQCTQKSFENMSNRGTCIIITKLGAF